MSQQRQLKDLTREELYELIWTLPATKVAADFGISDVAVRKHCIKHNVPKPRPGYWAKLAAGTKPRRTPLPPTADELFAKQAERPTKKRFALPEEGVPLHPLASELLESLNKAKLDSYKQVSLCIQHLPEVTISRPLASRVAKAFHVILQQTEALGIPFRKSLSSHETGYFKRGPDRLYLFIDELCIDKFKSERLIHSWQGQDGGTPSGRLGFRSRSEFYGLREQKEWVETKSVPLERVVAQIVSDIRLHYLNLHKRHVQEKIENKIRMAENERKYREWQAKEAIRIQKEKEQAHLDAIKSLKTARHLDLIRAAQWWQVSRTVDAYIDECEKRWRNSSGELNPEQLKWLTWARQKATYMSPFSTAYPEPQKHGEFDASVIPFGGPYPTAQNFPQPSFATVGRQIEHS